MCCVGLHDQRHHLAALVAQFGAQCVFVVAREARHDLLEMHRHVHRLLIDRQVFVARHHTLTETNVKFTDTPCGREQGQGSPCTPSKGPNHSNHRSAKCQRLRRPSPSNPIRPEANSQTAPGIGTALTSPE